MDASSVAVPPPRGCGFPADPNRSSRSTCDARSGPPCRRDHRSFTSTSAGPLLAGGGGHVRLLRTTTDTDDTSAATSEDAADAAVAGTATADTAPAIGRSVEFPLHGLVNVVVRFSPAILDPDCARYQEAADGPVDPNGVAAIRALGAPLTEWCFLDNNNSSSSAPTPTRRSPPPPLPAGSPPPLPPPPRLLMACNGVQSNFVSPWGWVVAGGRLVRPAWAEETHPWPPGTRLCGLVLEPPERAGMAQLCRRSLRAASASSTSSATAAAASSPAAASPPGGWEWRWPSDDGRGGARPPTAVTTALGGPPLVRRGEALPVGALPSTWAPPGAGRRRSAPDAVLWDPATTRAAFSAVGIRRRTTHHRSSGSGVAAGVEAVFVAVCEPVSVEEMARIMVDRGVDDAVLLGGSADVQQWVRHGSTRRVSSGTKSGAVRRGGDSDDGCEGEDNDTEYEDGTGCGGIALSPLGGGSLLVGSARCGSSNPGQHRHLNCVVSVHELVPELG